MTRTRWIIASCWLLLLWWATSTLWRASIESTLMHRAQAIIAPLDTGYGPISLRFSGQQALISGAVRSQTQRESIVSTLQEKLRHLGLNPIASVQDELALTPYPSGWLMLSIQGQRARLIGTVATEAEARDLSQLIKSRWTAAGGHLEVALHSDFSHYDEAPSIELTLAQLPSPRGAGGGDAAQVHIARLGEPWSRLIVDASDAVLQEQILALQLDASAWQQRILPEFTHVRRYQNEERARIAEAERQAKLPPPHIFLAARDKRLLVRGELATLAAKRIFLNDLIAAFPEWRVLDDLRVNPQRRSVADFGPITTALLPLGNEPSSQKSLALGLSDEAWKFVDWQSSSDTAPWHEILPADLPATLLKEDSRMVIEWLQGSAQGIPSLPVPAQPSFLTLTLLPDRVILAGQLAEEPLRTQLIEATRRTYGGRALVQAEALLARGSCEPTLDVEQTVRSFPTLPADDAPPLLAFARPGQVWHSIPATQALLTAGALAASPLFPSDFPSSMAEETFAAEGYDHLRHYWQHLPTEVAAPSPR